MGQAYGHFARRNAFIDRGWLGILSPIDAAVWQVYERFADEDGVAYPKPMTVAKAIRHDNADNVRKARRRLCRVGLLAMLDKGGGADTARVRVLVPPAATDQTLVDYRLGLDSPKARKDRGARATVAGHPRRPSTAAHKEEQTREQPKEQSAARASAAALFDDLESDRPASAGARARTPAPFRQFTDFWCEQKRREDPLYRFSRVDGTKLTEVWDGVNQNLDLGRKVIVAYLVDGTDFYEGHPSTKLAKDLPKFRVRAMNGRHANGRARAAAEQKRATEMPSDLPTPEATVYG
jgi:hypothetical protein